MRITDFNKIERSHIGQFYSFSLELSHKKSLSMKEIIRKYLFITNHFMIEIKPYQRILHIIIDHNYSYFSNLCKDKSLIFSNDYVSDIPCAFNRPCFLKFISYSQNIFLFLFFTLNNCYETLFIHVKWDYRMLKFFIARL